MASRLLTAHSLTYCIRRVVHKPGIPRFLSSKVADNSTWKVVDPDTLPEVPQINDKMIEHLERLSLVEFNNKEGIERLYSAVKYANQLHVVDTEGVEPMYSVLEDRELLLREDGVSEGGCKMDILKNAKKLEEDYFVAPPGNIPIQSKEEASD